MMAENVLPLSLLYLIVILILPHTDGAISFIKEPDKPSYVKKGNNATLVWDYSVTDRQKELKFIIWAVYLNNQFENLMVEYKNGNRVISSTVPSAYIGRVGIEGRASLVIENITTQDSTTLRCVLRTEKGLGLSDQISEVKLIVTETPQINISSVQSSYNEGSAVSIICTVSGTPDPHVQWIRNGTKITEGRKESSLTFNSINRTDDGQYTCKATNLAGHDEKHVTLVVNYTPEGTTLSTSAAGNTVTQGGSVAFTCDVTAAKPQVSRYRFYLNDTTLVKDSNDNQYTINNVQRSQHFGKYKCIPRNDVGDGAEAAVILNINVPVQFTTLPKNLTVNETNVIVVSCDASGFPKPYFTWTKDGQVLSQLKKLNIQSSHRSNSGMFVCTASNGVGQDKTAKAYVTVQYHDAGQHGIPRARDNVILPVREANHKAGLVDLG